MFSKLIRLIKQLQTNAQGGDMSVKMFVSPDILVSTTHSKLVRVGWVHENGIQPNLLFTLLHHHQFAERLKK